MGRHADTISRCKSLGFTCRWDSTVQEYRLARPLSAYRGSHRERVAQQETQAYYTDCSEDCCGTAKMWHDYLTDSYGQPPRRILSIAA